MSEGIQREFGLGSEEHPTNVSQSPEKWKNILANPYPQAVVDFLRVNHESPESNLILSEIVAELQEFKDEYEDLKKEFDKICEEHPEIGRQNEMLIDYLIGHKMSHDDFRFNKGHPGERAQTALVNFLALGQVLGSDLSGVVSRHLEVFTGSKSADDLKAGRKGYFYYEYAHDLYPVLNKLIKDGGVDIVYLAPANAVFPSQIFKGSMQEITKYRKDITMPYFAFPKYKDFRNISFSKRLNEETATALLNFLDVRSDENLKRTIETMQQDKREGTVAIDEQTAVAIIECIKLLDDEVVRQINGGKKKIRIALYDETINHGTTLRALKLIMHPVFEHVKRRYGVECEMIDLPELPKSKGGYGHMPSFFNGRPNVSSRASENYKTSNKRLETVDFSNHLEHSFARFTNNVANLTGRHFGFQIVMYGKVKALHE